MAQPGYCHYSDNLDAVFIMFYQRKWGTECLPISNSFGLIQAFRKKKKKKSCGFKQVVGSKKTDKTKP